jgi:hypothetical protein
MKHAPLGSADFTRVREEIRRLGHSIKPVLEIEEGSAGRRQIGTALIIRQRESAALVTAAHTVAGPTGKLVALAEGKVARWPRDYFTIDGVSSAIPSGDVAYHVGNVNGTASELMGGIPTDSFATQTALSSGASFIAVGYPASKAKFTYADSTLATNLMSVVCSEASDSVYADLNLDRRFHLAVGYDRDAVRTVDGVPRRGARAKGMSGGGLFIPMQNEQSGEVKLFLAGILIEHHEAPRHVFVAAHIQTLSDALFPTRPVDERTHFANPTRAR